MRNSVDTQWLTLRLVECEAVYRTGRSPEEMLLLADIWAQDLEGQDKDDVGRAFVMHRQEFSRFPCPADILRLLPRCRMTARIESPMALPVDTVSYNQPGRNMAKLLLQALHGDSEAQSEMERLRMQ